MHPFGRGAARRDDWIACGGKKMGFSSRHLIENPAKIALYFTLEKIENFRVA
jgi:hypothetical protein